jgi:hypothetical protein
MGIRGARDDYFILYRARTTQPNGVAMLQQWWNRQVNLYDLPN